jgi:hypothetical protein
MRTTKAKQKQKESIDSLNTILDNSDLELDKNLNDSKIPEIENKKPRGYLNIESIKIDAYNQAEDFINYLVEFYLAGDILYESYILKRMDDDKQTIADLLFQMKTSEYAIIKLLEVIDEGGQIIPRNFEVLAGLQKSKMEIVKHYEAIKMNIENNYKNMSNSYITKKENEIAIIESAGYGQKRLLEKIKQNTKLDEFGNPNVEESEYTIEKEHALPAGVKFYKNK